MFLFLRSSFLDKLYVTFTWICLLAWHGCEEVRALITYVSFTGLNILVITVTVAVPFLRDFYKPLVITDDRFGV